jgi:hypothetical protein
MNEEILAIINEGQREIFEKIKSLPITKDEEGNDIFHNDIVIICHNAGNFGVPKHPHFRTYNAYIKICIIGKEIKFLVKCPDLQQEFTLTNKQPLKKIGNLDSDPSLLENKCLFTWKEYLDKKHSYETNS